MPVIARREVDPQPEPPRATAENRARIVEDFEAALKYGQGRVTARLLEEKAPGEEGGEEAVVMELQRLLGRSVPVMLGTVLVLIPFSLAFLMTAASSVLLHIPLNFANIIVVPLLLGLGIDNGIHFVYRYRRDPSGNLNVLQTSTFRAVFYNTATSIVGFCTLIWMPHKGLSGMGIILTLCMTYVLICTVTLLPALIEMFKDRLKINNINHYNGS